MKRDTFWKILAVLSAFGLAMALLGCDNGNNGNNVERLTAPRITLAGSRVSWNAVAGAGGYSVRIGGSQVEPV